MAKELSLMGQLRKEADIDFSKYLKYVNEIFEKNKKLEEKVRFLEECLDKLMFDADIVNVKIHGELGDYVYVRSDKQFKLNVKD